MDYDRRMFGLGITELVIILVIVLVIFGGGKLPSVLGDLGTGIRNFRKSVKAPDEIDVTPPGEKEAESDQEGARPKQP